MASKTLFDHIKAITNEQDPKYWDKLEEGDKKTWSNYMVHRFISMNNDWVELVAELQPYTQELSPPIFYKLLIGVIPKGRHFLKYIRGSKSENYEGWLVELVVKDFQCSIKEAEEYLDILYATREGREEVKIICKKYGIEDKMITKLKLKV
jgi:hypothetical protein